MKRIGILLALGNMLGAVSTFIYFGFILLDFSWDFAVEISDAQT